MNSTILERVLNLMLDGQPRTLPEIKRLCGGLETTVSARLRDIRKNGFTVNKYPTPRAPKLYYYQVLQG